MVRFFIFGLLFVVLTGSASATAEMPASLPASLPIQSSTQPVYTGALKGEIKEAGTRLRLEDAVIRVQVKEAGYDQTNTTNARGQFEFKQIPPGQADITIAKEGYQKFESSETIEKNIETSVKFYLKKLQTDVYSSVIRGKKDTKEVSKRVISREEFTRIPGTFGDPLRAIQNMPSVARPAFFGGQLIIRGAAPSDSEIYLDGMRLPSLYHFAGGPSVLPERVLDEINFYPGGFSVRYGRATAGVIDIKTRIPDTRKITGSARVDIGVASLFLEIPLPKKTTLMLAARRSYIDAVLAPILKSAAGGGSSAPVLAPVFWDYQLRVTHQTDKIGDFSFFWYGSDDRLKFTQKPTSDSGVFNPSQLRVVLSFHSLQPTWTWKITPKLSHLFSAVATYRLSDIYTPSVNFRFEEWQGGFRDEFQYRASNQIKLLAGMELRINNSTLKTKLPFITPYRLFPRPDTEQTPFSDFSGRVLVFDFATYAELDLSIKKLRLIPGLRLEENGYLGRIRQSLQPRLSARYEVHPLVQLKAMVGYYQKQPPIQFILDYFGNPDLQLQSAIQSSVGAEWQITRALSLDFSGFFNYLWDLPSSSSEFLIKNGNITPTRFKNEEQGRVMGFDLLLRHKPYKNFFGWVAYTFSRSERKNPNEPNWFLFANDQTHILTLVASYNLPYGFQVGARFRLVTGNPTTPVRDSIFDADTGTYRDINGPARSARLPWFHQLDVRIDKKFTFKTWEFSMYLDVQNIYNQQNAEFFQYSYDYSQKQYFPGLPILPYLGIEAQF